jgi:hypothetical protein
MAQTGYTPIKLYASTTASAVPLAANLDNTNGAELAINITDGKLYYKDNGGTVQVLASKAAVTNVASISFGSTGLTPSTATTGAVTVAGTLATTNGGTGLTSFTSGGAVYASSTSALTTGTLPVASGGTNATATPTAGAVAYGTGTAYAFTAAGSAGQVLTSNGTGAPTWAASSGGISTGKAIAMAMIFGF